MIVIGINTGALSQTSGNISLSSVSFKDNRMDGNDEFPNLRHNIFINNNALLYVKDLVVDTYISMFILVDDDNTESKVEGVEVV